MTVHSRIVKVGLLHMLKQRIIKPDTFLFFLCETKPIKLVSGISGYININKTDCLVLLLEFLF